MPKKKMSAKRKAVLAQSKKRLAGKRIFIRSSHFTDGKKVILRLLPVPDDDPSIETIVGTHFIQVGGQGRTFICPEMTHPDSGQVCPACEAVRQLAESEDKEAQDLMDALRVTVRFWVKVIDRSDDPPIVKVAQVPRTVWETLFEAMDTDEEILDDAEEGTDFRVKAEGSGFNKEYKTRVLKESTPLHDDPQEVKRLIKDARKLDLAKYIKYDEELGAQVQVLLENSGIELDTASEDEAEMDYNEMTLKQLKKLAEERDIDTEDLKKRDIIEALEEYDAEEEGEEEEPEEEEEEEEVPYSEWSLKELKEEAKERDLDIDGLKKKKDFIELLEEEDEAGEEEEEEEPEEEEEEEEEPEEEEEEEEEPEEEEEEEEEADYSEWSKKELKEEAKERGLKFKKSASADDLRALLEEDDEAGEEPEEGEEEEEEEEEEPEESAEEVRKSLRSAKKKAGKAGKAGKKKAKKKKR